VTIAVLTTAVLTIAAPRHSSDPAEFTGKRSS
jgi:hypothetical protein